MSRRQSPEIIDAEFRVVEPRRIRWRVLLWMTLMAAVFGYLSYDVSGSWEAALLAFIGPFYWPLIASLADLGSRVSPQEAEELSQRLTQSARGGRAESRSGSAAASSRRDRKALRQERG